MTSWHPSTGGSPKGLTPPTSRKPRCYWKNSGIKQACTSPAETLRPRLSLFCHTTRSHLPGLLRGAKKATNGLPAHHACFAPFSGMFTEPSYVIARYDGDCGVSFKHRTRESAPMPTTPDATAASHCTVTPPGALLHFSQASHGHTSDIFFWTLLLDSEVLGFHVVH